MAEADDRYQPTEVGPGRQDSFSFIDIRGRGSSTTAEAVWFPPRRSPMSKQWTLHEQPNGELWAMDPDGRHMVTVHRPYGDGDDSRAHRDRVGARIVVALNDRYGEGNSLIAAMDVEEELKKLAEARRQRALMASGL